MGTTGLEAGQKGRRGQALVGASPSPAPHHHLVLNCLQVRLRPASGVRGLTTVVSSVWCERVTYQNTDTFKYTLYFRWVIIHYCYYYVCHSDAFLYHIWVVQTWTQLALSPSTVCLLQRITELQKATVNVSYVIPLQEDPRSVGREHCMQTNSILLSVAGTSLSNYGRVVKFWHDIKCQYIRSSEYLKRNVVALTIFTCWNCVQKLFVLLSLCYFHEYEALRCHEITILLCYLTKNWYRQIKLE